MPVKESQNEAVRLRRVFVKYGTMSDLELPESPHIHLSRPVRHPLRLPIFPSFASPLLCRRSFALLTQQQDHPFGFGQRRRRYEGP